MMMRKEIFKLAVPNILTNLTVPLVSLVDIGLMGRMSSSNFIISLGFGTLIFNFIYWLFGFLRMGTTGMVSQAFGARKENEMMSLLVMGLSISLVAGLICLVFQYPIFQASLSLIQPESAVVKPLSTYFYWRIYAAPATISVYVISGWLLGMQDSKAALFIALIINGMNAFISIYLVHFIDMGIKGVAIGTVVAQYTGLAIGLLFIHKRFKLDWRSFSFVLLKKLEKWKAFIKINSDLFIRTLCLLFAMSFFKTNAGNIDPILGAANILLLEFVTLSAYGIDGFAFAAEAVCGKYFGNGNQAKLSQAIKTSFLMGILFALLTTVIFGFFGEGILYLMTDKVTVVNAALPYLIWLVLMPVIGAFAFIWDGIYIGATASKAMRNSMIVSTFLIFLPLFFVLKYYFGNHGMWISFLIFLLARGLILSLQAKKAIYGRIV